MTRTQYQSVTVLSVHPPSPSSLQPEKCQDVFITTHISRNISKKNVKSEANQLIWHCGKKTNMCMKWPILGCMNVGMIDSFSFLSLAVAFCAAISFAAVYNNKYIWIYMYISKYICCKNMSRYLRNYMYRIMYTYDILRFCWRYPHVW